MTERKKEREEALDKKNKPVGTKINNIENRNSNDITTLAELGLENFI